MTNSNYFPGSKDCYFCDNPIEHLCTFRIIDKELAKDYFPRSVYGICRSTKLSLCEECSDDCQRFYSAHIPKLLCDTFNIDFDKARKDKRCSSIAKYLLDNRCEPNSRARLEKLLEETMEKSMCEINLQDLVTNLTNSSWKHDLGAHVCSTKNALKMISIVTEFFVEHKECGTLKLKMSDDGKEELSSRNKEKRIRKKSGRQKRLEKKQFEKNLVGELKKERYDQRNIAEQKFIATCNFSDYKQYLISEFDSIEKEFKILIENLPDTHTDALSKGCREKFTKLECVILNEQFKHECFLNGNIEKYRNQALVTCKTQESIIELDNFIENRKKDYERCHNVVYNDKRKRALNDDLNDDFIPFTRKK